MKNTAERDGRGMTFGRILAALVLPGGLLLGLATTPSAQAQTYTVYGTTYYGGISEGSTGCGIVFKIGPNATGKE